MGVTNGPGSEPLSAQTPRTLDSVTSAWLPAPPKLLLLLPCSFFLHAVSPSSGSFGQSCPWGQDPLYHIYSWTSL